MKHMISKSLIRQDLLEEKLLTAISHCSGVTLLSERSPSWASEIEHFENFSHPRENQLAQQFFVKFNLLLFFSHFLMLAVFYAYAEKYKHNDCYIYIYIYIYK